MRYILIDSVNGDNFTKEFEDRDEAIRTADDDWSCLSRHDKRRRDAFYVLESVNPDEEAVDHYDGDVVWNAK